MSKFRPYSKEVSKLIKKSPLTWTVIICMAVAVICYFFFFIYASASGKAYDESAKYRSVTETTYKYDKCRTAYLKNEDPQYEPYKFVFEKLDEIFIGPMNVDTYNNGINLYSKQSEEYKQSLNELINNLREENVDPVYKSETLYVEYTYFSDNSFTTYASNTKTYIMYFGWIIIILPAAFGFLFELPNKDMGISSVVFGLIPG